MRARATLCVLAFALGGLAHAQENRAWPAEVELAGPLRAVTLSMGDLGRTVIEGELAAGESRRLEVPLPAAGVATRFTPAIETDPPSAASSVRFVRWVDRPSDDIPIALRARTRPPIDRGLVRASHAALYACGAALVLACALARRPRTAFAVSLAFAVVVLALPPERAGDVLSRATVIEMSSAARCLAVEGSYERLEVAGGAPLATVAVEPAGAPIVWRVSLRDGARVASSPRARMYRLEVLDAGDRRATLERNDWGPLREVWIRQAGEWTARGSWALGEPLPPAVSGTGPPGWLATGLPQGVDVLVARADAEGVFLRATY